MKQIYRNTNRFIWFLLLLLIALAVYLQYMVYQSTDKLKTEEIFKTEIYAHHIAEWIKKKTHGEIEKSLSLDPVLREQFNEMLEIFLIPKYQYIFLLKKDKKDHYRFLLDGSGDEKEEYQTIFFPQSKVFDEVYRDHKVEIVKQKDEVKGVWLSLLYPIVLEGKTEALLVLDLSKWYGEYIENFNSPLNSVIRLMQIFLIVSFLVLLFISYRYYHLRKKVLYDPLTTAQTKLAMEEFFNRNRVDQYHAMLIDIDEFKEINRLYGYEKGDMVLKEFVMTLRSLLPKDASIIRIGGAEFFVYFGKNENLKEIAEKVFEKAREKKYHVDGEKVRLTFSISAMEIPDDTVEIQHVLHMLDEALLKIKSRGKNRLSILNVSTSKEIRHRNMDYIKEALEEERLVCYYQPVVNTRTSEIQKFEALVRLIDKDDPEILISPASFIDIIKGTSQYIKMSKLVLKKVFDMLEIHKDIEFSVNLDLNDLYNNDMMQMITHYLEEHKEVAYRLTFEIIEENEIEDYDKVNEIFNVLRQYGSKIAIDDFGSGYSNYNYLIHLDIDILKLDGRLIQGLITQKERAREVILSIKRLADTLGYEVVAEYVSSEEVYQEVKALGITYMQGYYLGKPQKIEAYIH